MSKWIFAGQGREHGQAGQAAWRFGFPPSHSVETCLRMIQTAQSGRVAQLGEHLLCKQGVAGSIPATSTKSPMAKRPVLARHHSRCAAVCARSI